MDKIVYFVRNVKLASCPLGPATGVGMLTEMHVIYMERYTSHCAHRSIGCCMRGGDTRKKGWKEGKLGNI